LQHGEPLSKRWPAERVIEQFERVSITRLPARGVAEAGEASINLTRRDSRS